MIDLHTHILPAIDDGVQTDEEALEFARMARDDGVTRIVATPHCKEGFYFNDRATVLAGVERLGRVLAREGVGIELLPGAEVHLCPDLLDRIRDGRAPTLNDNGKTLLLELSLTQYPVLLEKLLFQLKLAGIEVIFAHPERIRYFQDDPKRYAELVRLGAWGQITTGSITGVFGRAAREYSEQLLREGLVHVLASDGHNTRGRRPVLTEAIEAMEPWVGRRRAESMVDGVPAALLEGRAPEIPPLDTPRRSRTTFWSRWLRR